MNTKNVLVIMFLLVIAFAFGGCGSAVSTGDINNTDTLNSIDIPDQDFAREANYDIPPHCGDVTIKKLWGGQNIHVGWIAIWNDEDTIYAHYKTDFDWWISETHFAIAESVDGIPHGKKNNPKIGHFPYKGTYDPYVQDAEFMIPIEEGWVPGTELYLAAHAVVHLMGENGEYIQEETAWGDGCYPCEYVDKGSWAMFFTYEVQGCD